MNKINPQSIDAERGQTYELRCESKGKARWFFGLDSDLPVDKPGLFMGKVLVLKSVSLQHSGFYLCYGSTYTKRFWAKSIFKVYG